MDKKTEHEFFRRILTAFLTTILFFGLAVSVFCLWFVRENSKQELRSAESSTQQQIVPEK